MNTELTNTLQKLAWLELYAPLEGSTRRLAERLIRRGVKRTVLPQDPSSQKMVAVKSDDKNHNKPGEAEIPSPNGFPQKIAAFKAKYERS